eukprot:CAMPEP_0202442988 /NCGR_PEP_ID=MMETSP1360-20130828/2349_1 /ASSEMBLY_ACC=CAM_ASM_000848 /TAXON_ID=515479 /ORGANISM="Licmophora paradoxa, Strain CCMP2313" /LENGTH=158 /DNA_ID=CAMNT_0049058541 /DNA_START=101 /DNA_END=577 /DNA_ORIENTATION=-
MKNGKKTTAQKKNEDKKYSSIYFQQQQNNDGQEGRPKLHQSIENDFDEDDIISQQVQRYSADIFRGSNTATATSSSFFTNVSADLEDSMLTLKRATPVVDTEDDDDSDGIYNFLAKRRRTFDDSDDEDDASSIGEDLGVGQVSLSINESNEGFVISLV